MNARILPVDRDRTDAGRIGRKVVDQRKLPQRRQDDPKVISTAYDLIDLRIKQIETLYELIQALRVKAQAEGDQ